MTRTSLLVITLLFASSAFAAIILAAGTLSVTPALAESCRYLEGPELEQCLLRKTYKQHELNPEIDKERDNTLRTARDPPKRILGTGYEWLREVGSEMKGYGLYSYVLIPAASPASAALLNEIFKVIPDIRSTGALPSQLNILYIPFQNGKDADFAKALATSSTLGVPYLDTVYDYQMARAILNSLCNPPAPKIEGLCQGDLSRGPFIFTYAEPASKLAPVAPPYLLVDLREVHPRAFAEFVSAFQAQVKSKDVNRGARLNTLRLKILNIALTAADWTTPVPKAVADIAYSVTASRPQVR